MAGWDGMMFCLMLDWTWIDADADASLPPSCTPHVLFPSLCDHEARRCKGKARPASSPAQQQILQWFMYAEQTGKERKKRVSVSLPPRLRRRVAGLISLNGRGRKQ